MALALASPAIAAGSQQGAQKAANDPTTQQYANSLTGAENSAGSNGGNQPGSSGTAGEASGGSGGALGSLPFTGTDLVALAAIAVCLVATGVLLQTLTRPRRD